MILLLTSILIFNILAYFNHDKLTLNQLVHIWCFTVAFQFAFDAIIIEKYEGYWYFTKDIEWKSIPAYLCLIPPVNIMFLNWFPFNTSWLHQLRYYAMWVVLLVFYEGLTLVPEPFGFFTYGWWSAWTTIIVNPILLFILVAYYKFIVKVEAKL